MGTVNLAMEVWDTDEIRDGVFCTTLTHPLFDGKLTFLHGSEEAGEAFIKNLKDQFNAKYKAPVSAPAQAVLDWRNDVVDIVELAVQLEQTLSKRAKQKEKEPKEREREYPGFKRSTF